MIFNKHINSSSTPSLTLNSTSLTTKCMATAGTTVMQSTYAAQGVYMGYIDATAAGIKLNCPTALSKLYEAEFYMAWLC